MRKFLLFVLALSLNSQMTFAQEATNQANNEDSFQDDSSPSTAITNTETIEAATETQAEPAPAASEKVAAAPVATSQVTVAPQTPIQNTTEVKAEQSPIDVSGVYRQSPPPVARRPITEADKMKMMRARLEKQNEILVKKQMERMRLKQEMEMSKRIQKTFDESMKKLEETN